MNKVSLILLLSLSHAETHAQFGLDSVMVANSEASNIRAHKGLFGLAKPTFANYYTVDIIKLDSAIKKKKTKEDAGLEMELSSEGMAFDHSKYRMIEKLKYYKLILGNSKENTEAVFSIFSTSHEKKQTFLGKVLSKDDEGKDEILSYSRNIDGWISGMKDSVVWNFLIGGFTSGSRANSYGVASISKGFIKNDTDSLYMSLHSSFSADLVLIDKYNDHVAALAFKTKPLKIWLRKDMEESKRNAIAALFAVIISIKDN
jgi:hypothetical protein